MDCAHQLIQAIAQLPQVEAITIGGSCATGKADPASDYDVYVYVNELIPQDTRTELLKQYCSYMEIGNHFWELEDNCTLDDGIDIDILYRDLDFIEDQVADVVEHAQASNGYTTCIWHNIRTCTIEYDSAGRFAAVQQRFDVEYPDTLRDAIIERNMNLLHGMLPSYDAQIHKAAKRRDLVSVNHRVAAFLESYFDVLFAVNCMTHPGEKRQLAIAVEQCSLLPEHIEDDMHTLFSVMFTSLEELDAVLERLVARLQAVVA